MKTRTLAAFLVLPILLTDASPVRAGPNPRLQDQYQRSLQGVLSNLKSNGAIVASPSTSNPNYYFDWVRDTGLTMRALVRIAYDPRTETTLRSRLLTQIDRWIKWELRRQEQNRLTGLGEPRFHVDGSVNEEPWGRPQNDGPAIRALTAIEVADQWIREGRLQEVRKILYAPALPAQTLIKRDLEYVAHHWREKSFDLWEEEQAFHYYTLLSQRVALVKGARLAWRMSDSDAARFYEKEAALIGSLLQRFVNPQTGTLAYAIEKSPGLPHKRSDLDISVILALIHTYDGSFFDSTETSMQTLKELIKVFRQRYPLNRNLRGRSGEALGVSLGRYPEDIYDGSGFSGGNPWFLSTLASAEFLCDLSHSRAGKRREALVDIAVSQFNRVIHHLDEQGSMSEQFNRDTGFQQGARDLTWSYVAYLTAYRACFL
jgi:glucoamylase